MFFGSADVKIDTEGRFKLPVRFHRQIKESDETKMVLALHPDKSCVVLYQFSQWLEVRKRVVALPSLDKNVQKIARRLVQSMLDFEINDSGRILIPNNIKEKTDINKDIFIVAGIGINAHLEIWDKATWDSIDEQISDFEASKDFRL